VPLPFFCFLCAGLLFFIVSVFCCCLFLSSSLFLFLFFFYSVFFILYWSSFFGMCDFFLVVLCLGDIFCGDLWFDVFSFFGFVVVVLPQRRFFWSYFV